MKIVYLSLGSNLGERRQYLEQAILDLEAAGAKTLRRSSIYETEPQDAPAQALFLNMVLEVETELFPMQLLARIQHIEKELARKRDVPKGPRTIDIDILLFGHFIIDTPLLVVPHPEMTKRRFVLEPLAELSPELRHPVYRKSMRELLARVSEQPVRKLPAHCR